MPPVPPGPPAGADDFSPPQTVQASPTFRVLILIALYAVPAATVLRPLDEFDTWWHLRTGQWIAEHHTVPATDLFSTALASKPWIAYSWLFELLLHSLYQCFGLGGVILPFALPPNRSPIMGRESDQLSRELFFGTQKCGRAHIRLRQGS